MYRGFALPWNEFKFSWRKSDFRREYERWCLPASDPRSHPTPTSQNNSGLTDTEWLLKAADSLLTASFPTDPESPIVESGQKLHFILDMTGG